MTAVVTSRVAKTVMILFMVFSFLQHFADTRLGEDDDDV